MKVIFKYKLGSHGSQKLHMPANARILSVQFQGFDLVLWAVVEPSNQLVERRFHIFGTGISSPDFDRLCHLTTIQCGDLVWHIFEEPRCACSPPCIPWHTVAPK